MDRARGPASFERDFSGARAVVAAGLTLAFGCAAAQTDLTSLSLEQLLQVNVVGAAKYAQRQSEVAAAVSIVTRQEIRAFGWRTLDQVLASLPGLYLTYDRQYSYFGARGFGLPGDFTARLLVTINGNRVNDANFDQGPIGWQMPLDLDLVERIEFIAGPGGAVYGQNAMLGVVNIVTRDGGGVDGIELATGWSAPQRRGELRTTWGGRLGDGTQLLLSATALSSRGEDRFHDYGAAGVRGVATGLDGESVRQLFARATGASWSADFVYGNRRKNDPVGSYLSDPLVAGQYQSDRYVLANLQFEGRALGDALNWQVRLFGGSEFYDAALVYGTPFRNPAPSDWRGAELRLLYDGWTDHRPMIGIEVQQNWRVEQSTLDTANPANDIVIRTPGTRTGVYLQDEWRIAAPLLATLGLRLDRASATGAVSSPRLGLIWTADEATTLKALAGRAHRAPNAYERDYHDGLSQVANPALAGETIDTYELVADRRVGRDLLLRASLFRWTVHDLIVLGVDPASGMTQYQSGDDVKAHGIEFSFDRTWVAGTRLRGSVAAQRVRYGSGGELLNSPSLLGKLAVSGRLPWAGLRAGFEWQYDGRRLTLDGSKLGGSAVSSLHLSTDRLVTGVELTLGVRNLFAKRYAHPGADTNWQNAIEQDGRSVRAGVEVRF